MNSVAVIGAGWSGVTAALKLSRAGLKVTLFEAARIAGGRARRVERDGRVIDNGQHLLLGAYERTLSTIRSVHPAGNIPLITLPLVLESAPDSALPLQLQTPNIREPLNLLIGLLTAKGLSGTEKGATIYWASRTLNGGTVDASLTVSALIASQPIKIRALLWEPLCIAALNTPPETASAAVFVEVLRRTFSGTRNASQMLIPESDLTMLLPEPALAEVVANGGEVCLGSAVVSVREMQGRVCVALREGSQDFDAVIVAVAPQHVPRLLADEASTAAVVASLECLTYEPITTLYFEFSYAAPSPHEGSPMRMLDGEPGQWLFWSRRIDGSWRAGIVISAHRRTDDETALVDAALLQLSRSYRLPRPRWQFVITEKRATYACTPKQTALLSSLPKRVGDIHFAGDWCCPELPATIEAAVIAGERAADAVLNGK